jgi:hypothetical protein
VIAEVPTGLLVLQERATSQLLAPEGIVQEDEEIPPKIEVIEPDITSAELTVTVTLLVASGTSDLEQVIV